jgi:hypothetical protein
LKSELGSRRRFPADSVVKFDNRIHGRNLASLKGGLAAAGELRRLRDATARAAVGRAGRPAGPVGAYVRLSDYGDDLRLLNCSGLPNIAEQPVQRYMVGSPVSGPGSTVSYVLEKQIGQRNGNAVPLLLVVMKPPVMSRPSVA